MRSRSHESHDMRETSLESYGDLPQLGEMQGKVLDAIVDAQYEMQHPTDREIAVRLGMADPNGVRPRRFELMEAGLIVEAETRPCMVSGRNALTWKVSPERLANVLERYWTEKNRGSEQKVIK